MAWDELTTVPVSAPGVGRTMLQVMATAVPGVGFGLKAYTIVSEGVRFVVLLWNEETGDLQAVIEAGDLLAVERQGVLSWANVAELGQVVAGQIPGRPDDKSITLFESLGVAIEDMAVAWRVYDKAVASGVGQQLPETLLG